MNRTEQAGHIAMICKNRLIQAFILGGIALTSAAVPYAEITRLADCLEGYSRDTNRRIKILRGKALD